MGSDNSFLKKKYPVKMHDNMVAQERQQSISQTQGNIGNQAFLCMLEAEQGNGGVIPPELKSRVEAAGGYSLDDINVHTNSDKPAQLESISYTEGDDIYLAPGRMDQLDHELGHAVQQKRETIVPDMSLAGKQINKDPALEREATALGRGNLNLANSATPLITKHATSHVVQRMSLEDFQKMERPQFKSKTREDIIEKQSKSGKSMTLPQVYVVDNEKRLIPTIHYECRSCHKLFPIEALHLGHIIPWKKYAAMKIGYESLDHMEDSQVRSLVSNAYNDTNNLDFECQTCNTSHVFEENYCSSDDCPEESTDGMLNLESIALHDSVLGIMEAYTANQDISLDDFTENSIKSFAWSKENFVQIKSMRGDLASFLQSLVKDTVNDIVKNKDHNVQNNIISHILAITFSFLEELDGDPKSWYNEEKMTYFTDQLNENLRAINDVEYLLADDQILSELKHLYFSILDAKSYQLNTDYGNQQEEVADARYRSTIDHINTTLQSDNESSQIPADLDENLCQLFKSTAQTIDSNKISTYIPSVITMHGIPTDYIYTMIDHEKSVEDKEATKVAATELIDHFMAIDQILRSPGEESKFLTRMISIIYQAASDINTEISLENSGNQ